MLRRLAGFEMISEVGHGAIATVFRARPVEPQDSMPDEVAIKVLRPEYLTDLGFRARFEREGQMITALQHPAIIPVYAFGQQRDQLYIVMAYMPHGSLAERLLRGPLPREEALDLLARTGVALDYAHSQGLVHRDVKPSNILFDAADKPYLADFGIAWQAETGERGRATISGTPAYMSPEQVRREAEIGPASDLYGLGVLAFQLLTGQLPFQAETLIAVLVQHMEAPVPSAHALNSALPGDVDRVLSKALAKEPEERFESGAAFVAALRRALQGETVTVPEPVLSPDAARSRDDAEAALTAGTAAEVATGSETGAQGAAGDGMRRLREWRADVTRRSERQRQKAYSWLAARPARALLLVTLLAILCAFVAVLVVRSGDLRAGQEREPALAGQEAVAATPSPAVFLPLAWLEPGRITPTATAPPTPAPNLRLLYDSGVVTLLNISAEPVALGNLTLRRVSSDGSPSPSFQLSALRGVAGSSLDALPAGDCLQILSTDAVRERGPRRPGDCGTLRGWLATRETNQLFQRMAEGDSFELLRDDQVLLSCPLADGSCQFLVAQPE